MQDNVKPKKPIYKRWWLWVVVAVVALIVISIIASTPNADNGDSENQTQPAAATTEVEEEDELETITLGVGDTATINNWEVTLDSFEFVDRILTSGTWGYTAQEGNTYLRATVTATNMDSGPRTFLSSFSSGRDVRTDVIYNDNFTFTITRLITYRECLVDRATNPLAPATGSIVFSVADRAVESDESLALRFFNNREEIVFVLR